jgi:hypothetical protein
MKNNTKFNKKLDAMARIYNERQNLYDFYYLINLTDLKTDQVKFSFIIRVSVFDENHINIDMINTTTYNLNLEFKTTIKFNEDDDLYLNFNEYDNTELYKFKTQLLIYQNLTHIIDKKLIVNINFINDINNIK